MTVPLPMLQDDPATEVRGEFFESALVAWVFIAPKPFHVPDEGRTMFRTLDGGRTWQQQGLPPVEWTQYTLFSDNDGRSVWLGGQIGEEHGGAPPDTVQCRQLQGLLWTPVIFYKSVLGASWTRQSLPVETGCPTTLIRFWNSTKGVAVSQHSVFYTADGGRNWMEGQMSASANTAGPPVTLSFLEGSDQIGWLSFQEGAIFKTTDGGKIWSQIVKSRSVGVAPRGNGNWGAIYFATEKVGWMIGGDKTVFGAVYETHDGGASWAKLSVPERVTDLTGAAGICWLYGDQKLYRIDWR